MPLIDLTRFLAFHLTDRDGEVSILFSTGLVLEGLPSERHAAILRWVIDSKDAFFRYLRLLLSELGDPFAAALAAQEGSGHGAWRMADDDAPLLEEMVRAFCRGGDQLRAIERLIMRLETVEPGEADPIPAEFRTLWDTFRIALKAQGARMPNERFRAAPALAPLKAFQRRTVDYVFDRLYGSDDPVRQFLVADEVGLGKTMVARGVIARTIEHLWDSAARIDILYICSNQAIAAQNLNRLNVLGRRELALPTRMTLIPLQLRGQEGLDANKVNFISLTPGTTFDLRSATGVTQERALLLHLLEDLVSRPRGLHNLLQVIAGVDGWNRAVDSLDLTRHRQAHHRALPPRCAGRPELFEELERVCEMFPRRRDEYPPEMTQPRNSLVARLRAKLSHACVDALQPDLIIMDEFQRFRDLLHGDSDAAILARELFDYSGGDGHAARTLLLSATPYRMLTLAGDEPDEGDHYQDFLETLSFLYGRDKGPEVAATLAREMRAFRGFLHGLPASQAAAVEASQDDRATPTPGDRAHGARRQHGRAQLHGGRAARHRLRRAGRPRPRRRCLECGARPRCARRSSSIGNPRPICSTSCGTTA